MTVIILGSGVIGLTAARALQKVGARVQLWAKYFPPHTTSNVAAAIWYPYKAYPEEKIRVWSEHSYHVFKELSAQPGTGVRMVAGRKYFHRKMGFPWWSRFVPDVRRLEKSELPERIITGFKFSLPVIDTSIYLDGYLLKEFLDNGGITKQKHLKNLSEALEPGSLVINCTGLGAKTLCQDEALYPIRGQVTRISPIARREFLLDTDNPKGIIYVIPRENDFILGGVSEKNNFDCEVNPATAKAIHERCLLEFPEIKDAKVLGHYAGLRPGRDAVRLEMELLPQGSAIIHNYGHGGAGITLSWGCAEEVVRLYLAYRDKAPEFSRSG